MNMSIMLSDLDPPLISGPIPLDISVEQYLCFAAIAGVSTHLAYFIRGEHHLQAPSLFGLSVLAPIALMMAQIRLSHTGIHRAFWNTSTIMTVYLCALFGSMVVYRLFFHRLNGFPGPWMARTTKLWHCMKVLNFDSYRQIDKLHEEYGDFVRTGMSFHF